MWLYMLAAVERDEWELQVDEMRVSMDSFACGWYAIFSCRVLFPFIAGR
jgi:hypothetical protein